jgi:hypothetical protein
MNKIYTITVLMLWGIGDLPSPFSLCQATYTEDDQLGCRNPSPSTGEAEERSLDFSSKGITASQNEEEGAQQEYSYMGSFFNVIKKLSFWRDEQRPEQGDNTGLYKKVDGEDITPVIHSKAELQEVYNNFLAKNKIKPRPQLNPTAVFESLYEDYTNEDKELGWSLFYHSAQGVLALHNKSEIADLWALFQRYQNPLEKKTIKPFPQFIFPSSSDDVISSDDDSISDNDSINDATTVTEGDSDAEDDLDYGGNDNTEEDTD